MKRLFIGLLAIVACSSMFAETVKLNGLYYSLGSTTATVVADQTTDQSVYSALTGL